MPNIETTNHYYSQGNIELAYGQFRDEVFTAPGAGTFVRGLLLARDSTSSKLVPFAVGGANGTGTPLAVLTYDVVAAGAGDIAIRALVKGEVNRNRLIVQATGNGNPITAAHLDSLRDYGITPVDVQVLATQV